MNLLLCGISMICMCLFNSALSLLGGIAFSNLLLASVNLLPIIGVDGSQIVNNLGVTTRIVKPNQKGVDIYEFL